jgi:hypothetical protein
MPDLTFESHLSGQLRAYAEGGVRPIDRFAIAEAAITSGRTMPRWHRGWGLAPMRGSRVLIPLLVGLLLAALGGGALLVGGRLLAPPPLPMRHTYLNELVPAPDLPTPMTATLVTLADGRVLVIGSDFEVGHDITALVYDPATGASVSAEPVVPSGQWVGSALLLKDRRVLVLGDGVSQIFDPATMRFEAVGQAVSPRSGGSAALLLDGRVLIAGGFPPGGTAGDVPALRSAELFDPITMTSTPTGSIGTPTGGGPMVTLPDGHVFMASSDRAEIYDPATGTFGAASTTSPGGGGQPGGGHPVVLPDGRVVLVGSTGLYDGGRVQVWDPALRTFSTRDLSEPLTGATLLDDGRVFLIGMCRGRPAGWTGVYDPASEVTTPTPGTRACRPASTRLADGRVLIVGGVEPAVPIVEIFR